MAFPSGEPGLYIQYNVPEPWPLFQSSSLQDHHDLFFRLQQVIPFRFSTWLSLRPILLHHWNTENRSLHPLSCQQWRCLQQATEGLIVMRLQARQVMQYHIMTEKQINQLLR